MFKKLESEATLFFKVKTKSPLYIESGNGEENSPYIIR